MNSEQNGKNRARILIVDDERVLAGTLAEFLESEQYQVAVAYDAVEAMRQLAQFEPEIVLCDIQLPGASGLQLLAKMRTTRPDLSVVMITAYATVEAAIQAFQSGASDFLIKPVNFDDLTARLDHLLQFRQLASENRALKRKISRRVFHESGIESLVGSGRAMRQLKQWLVRVGPTRSNILITGESGTGKELAARAIHELGDSPEAPFLAINCAAIPSELLENQLFGHVKGAFTGADRDRDGLFAAAGSGSVFLDEIGELALGLQAKLLRVIENREIMPVGANQPARMKARIIAATNKDLADEVKNGKFRADLYFRLNVVTVPMPPLKSRLEDIPELVEFLVRKHAERMGKRVERVDQVAIERLQAMEWPGNVRELDNLLERAVILADNELISEQELFTPFSHWQMAANEVNGGTELQSADREMSQLPMNKVGAENQIDDLREAIRQFEKSHLKRVLAECGDDRRKAAARLGLGLSSLYAKIKEHALSG